MTHENPHLPLRRLARLSAVALAMAAPAAAIAAEPAAEPEAAAETVALPLPSGPRENLLKRIEDPLGQAVKRAAKAAERRTEIAAARRDGPFHPVDGQVSYGDVQAAFGNARGRPHEGQDIFATAGTPVVAPVAGIVVDAGSDGGRGNWAAIYDPERKQTYSYFHMIEAATVAPGEKVKAGQRVGKVGCTGSCWGDHLHFEVREGKGPYGAAIDPMPMLARWKPLSH